MAAFFFLSVLFFFFFRTQLLKKKTSTGNINDTFNTDQLVALQHPNECRDYQKSLALAENKSPGHAP